MKSILSSINYGTQHETDKFEAIGSDSEIDGPPTTRSEDKREATSPVDVQDLLKKTRHETGGSDASAQFEPTGEPKEVNSQSNTGESNCLIKIF